MRALRLLVLLPLALTSQLSMASALDLEKTVMGVKMGLALPAGFCLPDMSNSADAYFVNTVTKLLENSGNSLAQVTLGCSDRERRRALAAGRKIDGNIYNYLTYYYPTKSEHQNDAQSVSRKSLCDDLRAQDQSTLKDVSKIVAQTAKEMGNKMKLLSSKYMGVLAEDDHGCYAGLLLRVGNGATAYLVNAVVVGSVYHQRALFFALYSKYVSPAASEKSLQTAKELAADMDVKNPD